MRQGSEKADALMVSAERIRVSAQIAQDEQSKKHLAQYLSPQPVAMFMASLFDRIEGNVVLLDPGAGTGILTAAFAAEIIRREELVYSAEFVGYEIDTEIQEHLRQTLACSAEAIEKTGAESSYRIVPEDFILASRGHDEFMPSLLDTDLLSYTHVIMNPPYKKIGVKSAHRLATKEIGLDTSNLYSAFLAVSIQQLQPGGELVAIVPRSFCNGTYFRAFRRFLLQRVSIKRIHVFKSRSKAFRKDSVLQGIGVRSSFLVSSRRSNGARGQMLY